MGGSVQENPLPPLGTPLTYVPFVLMAELCLQLRLKRFVKSDTNAMSCTYLVCENNLNVRHW